MMVSEKEMFQVAEVEITYKPKFKAIDRPIVRSSNEVYALLKQLWNKNKIELLEEFKLVLLNKNNRVLGVAPISSGGVSGTVVDPKIIFSIALKANASTIILAHNHPSGNLKPSYQDISITKKLKEGGKLLEIDVHDHIIMTEYGYLSFADEGLMYP